MHKLSSIFALVGAIALVSSGCGSSNSSSQPSTAGSGSGAANNAKAVPGISPSTITLGYVTSLTGDASSSFADGAEGAEARIDLQNAEGGVDGRKIQLVVKDDQSSPTENATVSSELLTQNVFGVIDFSSFTFGGARVLQHAGVPVTGYGFDGPEWGLESYSNMFSFSPPLSTPYNGVYYAWGYEGLIFKMIGVTKLAGLAYGSSPSAVSNLKGQLAAAKQQGINICYENTSVPFGGVDFTAAALAIKSAGCNGVTAEFVDASDIALSQAVKNAGIQAQQMYLTGYDQDVLGNPSARAAFDDVYVQNLVNFTSPNAGTQVMLNALRKYDPHFTGGLPDYGLYSSYIAADLMIKGLETAGKNPTRTSFIHNLRQVTNYDAGGILPSPTSFANFGTQAMLPQRMCTYYFQLKSGGFVSFNDGKPLCGNRLAVP